VAGGVPPYAYAWHFGDGDSSFTESPARLFLTAGDPLYSNRSRIMLRIIEDTVREAAPFPEAAPQQAQGQGQAEKA